MLSGFLRIKIQLGGKFMWNRRLDTGYWIMDNGKQGMASFRKNVKSINQTINIIRDAIPVKQDTGKSKLEFRKITN